MLIYLDSSQFDWLERAPAREQQEFIAAWRSVGCELALSLHHLQEMGQVEDEVSLNRRLVVLDLFPTIRCLPASSQTVLQQEVRGLLRKLYGHGTGVDTRELGQMFFPASHTDRIGGDTLASQDVFHMFRAALEQGADAENLSKLARPERPLKIPADTDWDALYQRSLKEVERAVDQNPAVAPLMRRMFDTVFELARKHHSARGVLVALYGLQDIPILKEIPDDDLVSAYVFYSSAREEALRLAAEEEREPQEFLALADRISMYDAPGYRLKVAARRGRRPHPKEAEPGDQMDEDHVAFAPYVDLLVADKRTATFISQEARRYPALLPPEAANNIRRVASLSELRELITGFARANEAAR